MERSVRRISCVVQIKDHVNIWHVHKGKVRQPSTNKLLLPNFMKLSGMEPSAFDWIN